MVSSGVLLLAFGLLLAQQPAVQLRSLYDAHPDAAIAAAEERSAEDERVLLDWLDRAEDAKLRARWLAVLSRIKPSPALRDHLVGRLQFEYTLVVADRTLGMAATPPMAVPKQTAGSTKFEPQDCFSTFPRSDSPPFASGAWGIVYHIAAPCTTPTEEVDPHDRYAALLPYVQGSFPRIDRGSVNILWTHPTLGRNAMFEAVRQYCGELRRYLAALGLDWSDNELRGRVSLKIDDRRRVPGVPLPDPEVLLGDLPTGDPR